MNLFEKNIYMVTYYFICMLIMFTKLKCNHPQIFFNFAIFT